MKIMFGSKAKQVAEFVLWTIDQNFGGLENILIPGNVGTTPVQNIRGIWNRDKGYFCFL
jgi:UDP-N-acetylmuramate dehydrogenase